MTWTNKLWTLRADAIKELQTHGYQGFLIGEHFMKTENPGLAAKTFVTTLIR